VKSFRKEKRVGVVNHCMYRFAQSLSSHGFGVTRVVNHSIFRFALKSWQSRSLLLSFAKGAKDDVFPVQYITVARRREYKSYQNDQEPYYL
jgi:hypothetical protein